MDGGDVTGPHPWMTSYGLLREGESVFSRNEPTDRSSNPKWSALSTCICEQHQMGLAGSVCLFVTITIKVEEGMEELEGEECGVEMI